MLCVINILNEKHLKYVLKYDLKNGTNIKIHLIINPQKIYWNNIFIYLFIYWELIFMFSENAELSK